MLAKQRCQGCPVGGHELRAGRKHGVVARERREQGIQGGRGQDELGVGAAQQAATVTISSELNLLIVGVVLVAFVILAPEGIVGLARRLVKRERA